MKIAWLFVAFVLRNVVSKPYICNINVANIGSARFAAYKRTCVNLTKEKIF